MSEIVERIWARDSGVWTGADEGRWLGLARRAVADARGRRPAAAVRGLGRRPRRRRRPARHGRLVARARGDQAHVPAGDVPRPRHDAPAGDQGARGADRRLAHALHLGVQVRLDAGDALAHRLLLGARGAQRRSLRRDHRPRLGARAARAEARVRRDLPGRAEDRRPLLGAVRVRDGACGADGHRRLALPRPGDRDGGGVPSRRGQPRAGARALTRRAVARGPRQDLHRGDAGRLRALGRAAARRVDGQARQGVDPRARRAGGRARPAGAGGASERRLRARAGVLPLGVRDGGRRVDPGDQPVRPAGRAVGEGQDEGGAGVRLRIPSSSLRARPTSCSRRREPATTSPSWRSSTRPPRA